MAPLAPILSVYMLRLQKDQTGYTALELIVVLAIVVILIALIIIYR